MIKQELRQIAKDIIKDNALSDIKIQFKHTYCGRARPLTRKITIPMWTVENTRAYAIYYVIHELTHFIVNMGHGEAFKNKEREILEKYNMKPIYKKVYVKYLTDLEGNKLCQEYGKEIR